MSDPRINPPRSVEPAKTNTIYYIVGGLVVAVILGYWLMSRGSDVATTTGDDNSVTIETPAVDPAPADPVDPPVADPVDPAPADPVEPAPADPVEPAPTDPVDPPVVDPAAPATNP